MGINMKNVHLKTEQKKRHKTDYKQWYTYYVKEGWGNYYKDTEIIQLLCDNVLKIFQFL